MIKQLHQVNWIEKLDYKQLYNIDNTKIQKKELNLDLTTGVHRYNMRNSSVTLTATSFNDEFTNFTLN